MLSFSGSCEVPVKSEEPVLGLPCKVLSVDTRLVRNCCQQLFRKQTLLIFLKNYTGTTSIMIILLPVSSVWGGLGALTTSPSVSSGKRNISPCLGCCTNSSPPAFILQDSGTNVPLALQGEFSSTPSPWPAGQQKVLPLLTSSNKMTEII